MLMYWYISFNDTIKSSFSRKDWLRQTLGYRAPELSRLRRSRRVSPDHLSERQRPRQDVHRRVRGHAIPPQQGRQNHRRHRTWRMQEPLLL